MTWYAVKINDKTHNTGSAYVQANPQDSNKIKSVKKIAEQYGPKHLGLQGVRYISVIGEIDKGEKEVKRRVLGGGFNEMIYHNGKKHHRGTLPKPPSNEENHQ